jgi:hypothetical protein
MNASSPARSAPLQSGTAPGTSISNHSADSCWTPPFGTSESVPAGLRDEDSGDVDPPAGPGPRPTVGLPRRRAMTGRSLHSAADSVTPGERRVADQRVPGQTPMVAGLESPTGSPSGRCRSCIRRCSRPPHTGYTARLTCRALRAATQRPSGIKKQVANIRRYRQTIGRTRRRFIRSAGLS